MKINKLTNDNIIEVTRFIANELSKLIELLNLDYVIINGYVNKFDKLIIFIKNINGSNKIRLCFHTTRMLP